MNDVQSLMTAAAILVMGGFGLFMYKGEEDDDTHVEKQDIQENLHEDEDTQIKPKKTRKMRKRSGGGSRHRTGAPFGTP
jgi:hypothetical protein